MAEKPLILGTVQSGIALSKKEVGYVAGTEFLLKAVCQGSDGLPIIRYLTLTGEFNRNDLVEAAAVGVCGYLKGHHLLDQNMIPMTKKEHTAPGFLPCRLAFVAFAHSGDKRVLLIRSGSKTFELAHVAAKAAADCLGHQLRVATLVLLGTDVKQADGFYKFQKAKDDGLITSWSES